MLRAHLSPKEALPVEEDNVLFECCFLCTLQDPEIKVVLKCVQAFSIHVVLHVEKSLFGIKNEPYRLGSWRSRKATLRPPKHRRISSLEESPLLEILPIPVSSLVGSPYLLESMCSTTLRSFDVPQASSFHVPPTLSWHQQIPATTRQVVALILGVFCILMARGAPDHASARVKGGGFRLRDSYVRPLHSTWED